MSGDLFSSAAQQRQAEFAPLADRLRPVRLDEFVGQDHLLAEGGALRVLVENDRVPSMILWGPPGTGKTTLARLIAGRSARHFEALSAVSATVSDVRRTAAEARSRLGERSVRTILFLDEVHRFTRTQQDALLPHVEEGLLTLIGATTENPHFSVNGPLMSRCTLFRLRPLEEADLDKVMARGLEAEESEIEPAAAEHLVAMADGDARHLLTTLEVAVSLARPRAFPVRVTLADAEAAIDTRARGYGPDEHYDVTSAFIKSIRGSDPDAGLYWLARMLEAGEDPRFIARRLVILASEDVGEAHPQGLLIADAAARAVEFVGLPEAQLNLAHAVVHLACAPKSNAVTAALAAARHEVRSGAAGAVPDHLRDAHYRGAASLGHGTGYVSPHDHPDGWVAQGYRPPEVADQVYYRPGPRGAEVGRADELAARRRASGSSADGGRDPGGPEGER